MFRPIFSRFVAVVGLTLAPQFVMAQAQSSSWQARFDAGWEAYQQGNHDEAAGLLGAAEREARTFPADDPRLAAVSDRLAWVDFARGKLASAEARAAEALTWRERIEAKGASRATATWPRA